MIRKSLILLLKLLTGICLTLPAVSSAAATGADNDTSPSFRLQLEQAGEHIEVSLWGEELVDVYAFEIRLQFESAKLRFAAADMSANGFSLEPKTAGDSLLLAHTKIGAVAGDNGSVKLATVAFERLERIASEEALIAIESIILVDSQLNRHDAVSDAELLVPSWAGIIVLTDISGHWAEAAIAEAVELGLVRGYRNGTFKPDDPITRAEFAALLVRARGLPIEENVEAALPFADSDAIPLWAKPEITATVQLGIINGYDDGTFRPHHPITRAEMGVMIARALELPADDPALEPGFADTEDIPLWAKQAIAAVEQAGIMKGRGAGYFFPLENATRAEATILILALFNI